MERRPLAVSPPFLDLQPLLIEQPFIAPFFRDFLAIQLVLDLLEIAADPLDHGVVDQHTHNERGNVVFKDGKK